MSRRVHIWKTLGLSHPSRRAECGEYELQRSLEAQQLLLFPHDEVIGVIIGLGVTASVLVYFDGLATNFLLVD